MCIAQQSVVRIERHLSLFARLSADGKKSIENLAARSQAAARHSNRAHSRNDQARPHTAGRAATSKPSAKARPVKPAAALRASAKREAPRAAPRESRVRPRASAWASGSWTRSFHSAPAAPRAARQSSAIRFVHSVRSCARGDAAGGDAARLHPVDRRIRGRHADERARGPVRLCRGLSGAVEACAFASLLALVRRQRQRRRRGGACGRLAGGFAGCSAWLRQRARVCRRHLRRAPA